MRHVFVGERRSNTRVEGGPTDKGAAILMGHNVLMWDRIYDRAFKGRETQNAVNAMAGWRGRAGGRQNSAGMIFCRATSSRSAAVMSWRIMRRVRRTTVMMAALRRRSLNMMMRVGAQKERRQSLSVMTMSPARRSQIAA